MTAWYRYQRARVVLLDMLPAWSLLDEGGCSVILLALHLIEEWRECDNVGCYAEGKQSVHLQHTLSIRSIRLTAV
jgi:hypothetical protein